MKPTEAVREELEHVYVLAKGAKTVDFKRGKSNPKKKNQYLCQLSEAFINVISIAFSDTYHDECKLSVALFSLRSSC